MPYLQAHREMTMADLITINNELTEKWRGGEIFIKTITHIFILQFI